jgi:hypothetical protein
MAWRIAALEAKAPLGRNARHLFSLFRWLWTGAFSSC